MGLKELKPRNEQTKDENTEHETKMENQEIITSNSKSMITKIKPYCATEAAISGFLQPNQESQVENIAKRKPR